MKINKLRGMQMNSKPNDVKRLKVILTARDTGDRLTQKGDICFRPDTEG